MCVWLDFLLEGLLALMVNASMELFTLRPFQFFDLNEHSLPRV